MTYAIKDYLSVNGSFDSSWKLSVISSPIVEVCATPSPAAKATGTSHFTFKHTSGITPDRVEAAKAALIKHRAIREAFQAKGESLLRVLRTLRSTALS